MVLLKKLGSQTGITILEVLMILVVIALISAGFFLKRTIEYQAKISTEIVQISKYESAFNKFKSTYNGLPGDLVNAVDYWSLTKNGDGDSNIRTLEGRFSDEYNYGGEMSHVFEHLSLSGVLDEKYDSSIKLGQGIPTSKLNNKLGISLYNGSIDFISINAFYGNASALPSLEEADEPNHFNGNTSGFLSEKEVNSLEKKLGSQLFSFDCGIIKENNWCRYWYLIK